MTTTSVRAPPSSATISYYGPARHRTAAAHRPGAVHPAHLVRAGHTVVSALLAVCALIFIVPTLANGLLWGLSAPGVRKFGGRSRQLARDLLGEVVADLQRRRRGPPCISGCGHEAGRLAVIVIGAGGKARVWDNQLGSIRSLPPGLAELAAGEGVRIGDPSR